MARTTRTIQNAGRFTRISLRLHAAGLTGWLCPVRGRMSSRLRLLEVSLNQDKPPEKPSVYAKNPHLSGRLNPGVQLAQIAAMTRLLPRAHSLTWFVASALVTTMTLSSAAQTRIEPHKNSYS